MNNKTKITIVTVTYNCVNSIQNTIESIKKQTYPNIEYIIKDGGSIDGTLEIIKNYQIDLFESCKDSGIFNAMNRAIELATGDWIIFINSGDCLFDENVIENIFDNEYNGNVGVIYGNTLTSEGQLKDVPFFLNKKRFKQMGICHQSLFVRTDLAKKFMFDESYKVAADYNMIMNIYKCGYEFVSKDIFVSTYDLYGFSEVNRILQMKEEARICDAEHSLSFYFALLRELLKICIKKMIKK